MKQMNRMAAGLQEDSGEKAHTNGEGASNAQSNGATTDESKEKDQTPAKDDKPKKEEKKPAGGFESTPIPYAPPGYTIKITFHRATNLPMADINSLSSDPFILAQMYTGLPARHKEDPPLMFRTPTIRRNTDPEWNTEWILANVPAHGFKLKCRLYDEDPADHDDRLGNATVIVPSINENWQGIKDQSYKVKKHMGSKRAYLLRAIAVCFQKTKHMDGHLFLSIEVLGKSQEQSGGRCYTVGPMWCTKHYSPMLGRITGKKEPSEDEKNDKGEIVKPGQYNFQANQFQLHGPVPPELYHRFVEFKPFVKRMFTSSGVRGWLLSKALHHQHARVYNFDRTTEYTFFKDGPCKANTLKFLELVRYDQGGRIFTYVLTLDSLFRFTETGKEFGIDFLSKHTMHSDVSIYIAFSGEFFVRRLKHKNRPVPEESSEGQATNASHPPDDIGGGPPEEDPPKDPRKYELVIDNDSGTYRPNADLLPKLKEFLEYNLPGLHILTLDCQKDAELQQKMKSEQRERKKKEGDHIIYRQMSRGSSISSSDISDLDELEQQQEAEQQREKGLLGTMGKDVKQRGKTAGEHWKGVVKGRDGKPLDESQNSETNGAPHDSTAAESSKATKMEDGQGEKLAVT